MRVTDTNSHSRLAGQLAAAGTRVAATQEQLTSGKRINRASDDPAGAAAVLRLRTSQAEVEQFGRNAGAARGLLTASDAALESYETALDRAATLMTQGASDTLNAEGRASVATQLEALRPQLVALANTGHSGHYVFGGTRQSAPPFAASGAPSPIAAAPQRIQVEPNASAVSTGATAETIFTDATGNVFNAIDSFVAALRGTGDPAADKAAMDAGFQRLGRFSELARAARTGVGVALNTVEAADERAGRDALNLQAGIDRIETADFAQTALNFSAAERALEAVIQTTGHMNRTSLIDLLG